LASDISERQSRYLSRKAWYSLAEMASGDGVVAVLALVAAPW
jgi:hypothetical protein